MTEVIPRAPNVIRDATLYSLLPLWMDNLGENLPRIRVGLDAHDLVEQGKPALIIGAGPSLTVYKHLQLIKRSGWKNLIFVCDKMLGEALHTGIKPDYVATVDGNPIINNFYNRHEVKENASNVTGIFNVLTHPKVIETWIRAGGQPWWFVPMMDEPDEKGKIDIRGLTTMMYYLTKQKGMISGMGNVGAFLWNVAAALKCSPIILCGFDFSEQIRNKADAVYFDFYTKWFMRKYNDVDKAQDAAAVVHQLETNPDFIAPFTKQPYYKKGEHPRYLVNPMWKFYRDNLAMHVVSSGIHTVNATGNGCIHTQAKDEKGDYILKVRNFEALPLGEALERFK